MWTWLSQNLRNEGKRLRVANHSPWFLLLTRLFLLFFLGVADRNDVYTYIYFSVLILFQIVPYSSSCSIVFQSTLVPQDVCFSSCATMFIIIIIQRPQRLFYNFYAGRNQREESKK